VLPTIASEVPLPPDAIYQNVLPMVMTLEVETRGGEIKVGTAFLAVREGVAVTAWHLVQDARKVTARFADHATCEVDGVLDWDEVKDIALVKLTGARRSLSRLCLTNPPVGARAYVIGAPKGYEFSISDGLVSQVQFIDGFAQYQISCPISPGNSGGPLLDARGEVLGVVSWSKKDGQNLNFATPSASLLALHEQSPVIPWAELAQQRRGHKQSQVAARERDRLSVAPIDKDLAELRAWLQRSAGTEVTVTVKQGSDQRAFKVRLPKDFVR